MDNSTVGIYYSGVQRFMIQKELRVRIHPVLYKKYKMVCTENDLSIPKQTAELIRKFIEICEENKKLLRDLK